MTDLPLNDRARAIVSAHLTRLALPLPQNGLFDIETEYTQAGDIYLSAKQACLALGFIEQDAQCVAIAWQAQFSRTGHFDPADWPVTAEDFCMQAWPRHDAFAPCPKKLGLYAVLPDAAWVRHMAEVGVPTLQLRFKSEDPTAIEREVKAAVAAVQGTASLLFINDHWQAAIEAGAYGVHLGQEDMAVADLSAIKAAGLRLGLSSHGYAEMVRADALSPSYIAMGAVFPTTLKRMATAPQGLGRLYAYAQLMHDYPLVAIGGIDAEKFFAVLSSGVGSIAVVRAITAATDPQAAAKALMAQFNSI
jgi:thiamine-phosphate pyrophosphorylase